jgi:hypothetical protein
MGSSPLLKGGESLHGLLLLRNEESESINTFVGWRFIDVIIAETMSRQIGSAIMQTMGKTNVIFGLEVG